MQMIKIEIQGNIQTNVKQKPSVESFMQLNKLMSGRSEEINSSHNTLKFKMES